jgi:hypothetical protein
MRPSAIDGIDADARKGPGCRERSPRRWLRRLLPMPQVARPLYEGSPAGLEPPDQCRQTTVYHGPRKWE